MLTDYNNLDIVASNWTLVLKLGQLTLKFFYLEIIENHVYWKLALDISNFNK